MTGFHEVRFPDNIAYGATGGPEFATTVVATGAATRSATSTGREARGRWDVASGLKKQAQIDELIAFFRARKGKAYGFRFKDWTDYKATGQLLGTGDDAIKTVPAGQALPVGERDRGPDDHQAGRRHGEGLPGRRRAALGLVGRHDDRARHLQRRRRPLGVEVTADFEFDVPVRFDTDHMAVTIETYPAAQLAADPDRRAQALILVEDAAPKPTRRAGSRCTRSRPTRS